MDLRARVHHVAFIDDPKLLIPPFLSVISHAHMQLYSVVSCFRSCRAHCEISPTNHGEPGQAAVSLHVLLPPSPQPPQAEPSPLWQGLHQGLHQGLLGLSQEAQTQTRGQGEAARQERRQEEQEHLGGGVWLAPAPHQACGQERRRQESQRDESEEALPAGGPVALQAPAPAAAAASPGP